MSGYAAAGAALLIAAAVIVYDRWQTARREKRLEEMLRAAMEGRFDPEEADRGELSPLERSLLGYLSSGALVRRDLGEQRERAQAFLSDLSRQTRGPLDELERCAGQLARQSLPPQEEAWARAVSAQAEKLRALLEALVQAGRLETGGLVLRPQEDDLTQVVRRAAAQYAPRAWDKEVSLRVGKGEERAVFDAKWTQQALCCLLDNAVAYTPPGGTIQVEVENLDGLAAVRISDTGPGIPEQEQKKIFQRFYRAAGACPGERAGMGLYLARQIAEKQGGRVEVESVLGKGSTFSLYLPGPPPAARP